MKDSLFALQLTAITSLILGGIFVMAVRGRKRHIRYMSMFRFFTAIIMIFNLFQTFNSHIYGYTIWNPLHLFSLLLGFPLLFAYMFSLMRPGSVGQRYWLLFYLPIVGLVLLHILFNIFRGPLPLFSQYDDMRNYLGEPGMWVRFTALILVVKEVSICSFWTVRMLRRHRRNVQADFSYMEGSTLGWMWWNHALLILIGMSVLAMFMVEGIVSKMVCAVVMSLETVFTTTWALRQGDLYLEKPVKKEEFLNSILTENESVGFELPTKKRTLLKRDLLNLLENDEIFMDPALNSDKICVMLQTNRTYLSQIINQDLKTNFYNLINTYRLKKAVEILKDPQYQRIPLRSIAEICGFKNTAALSIFFKQTYGITPKEWRDKETPDSEQVI